MRYKVYNALSSVQQYEKGGGQEMMQRVLIALILLVLSGVISGVIGCDQPPVEGEEMAPAEDTLVTAPKETR